MGKILNLTIFSTCFAAVLAQDPSPYDLDRVQPGAHPPDFTLPTPDGGKVTLSDLRGKNVVLVFYRGYW